jgi:hypothetical protein
VNADDAELREAVAAERGLPDTAAPLLLGSTLAELEASADQLARLVGERGRGEAPAPPADPIVAALADKQRRKQALADLIIGRSRTQPRDERGRFAPPGSLDGGARKALPARPPSHDEWVAEVIRRRLADRGAAF